MPANKPESFRDFDLREPLLRTLDEAGFDTPTPIQRRAIPVLLQGGDLIGVAQTGTGKTLAYLLPIFQRLDLAVHEPQALVVCPTRELALQVAGEAERFGRPLGVSTVVAYGGTSTGGQKQALGEGRHLVVATPGRLLDFINSAWLSLRKLRYLVLDEADRMLDMGFINDVDAILRRSPMSRQTMLFSATFPEQLRTLTERYMFHPDLVRMHTGTRVTDQVDHAFYPVAEGQKVELLLALLKHERPTKGLIFTATREGTSELATKLRRRGLTVVSLSSLLSQANRERALDAFRRGEYHFLVATDVAARGLDITDIDLVVNFDPPMLAEDYVHRIGRTGRMERTGRAITLITRRDERRASEIERLLDETIPREALEGFEYRTAPPDRGRRSRGPAAGRRRRTRGTGKPATAVAERAAAATDDKPASRPRRRRRRSGKKR